MNKHSILKKSFSCIMAVALMLNSATYAGEFDLFEPAESFEEVAAEEFDILGEESVAEILPEFDVIEEPVVEEEPILLDSIAEEDIFDFGDESVVAPAEDIIFLDEAPAFEKGYVSVKAETAIYEKESTEKKIGSFVEDAVVYAVASDIVTVENDKWLKITFDTADAKEKEEDLMTGYVLDKDVTVLTDEEVNDLVDTLILDETTRDFEDNLLPVVKFAPAEEEAEDAVIEVFGLDEEEFDTDLQEEEFDVVEVLADEEEAAEESEEELFDVVEVLPVVEEAEVEAAEEAFDGEEVVAVEEELVEVLEEAEETEDEVEAAEEEISAAGTVTITKHPVDLTVVDGGNAVFSVEASGTNLSYQWQTRMTPASAWMNTGLNGNKTNTLSFKAISAYSGRQFRCVVKDTSGGQDESNPATLTIGNGPVITGQPESIVVEENGTAVFTVKATGTDLKYRWQTRMSETSSWINTGLSGYNTDTLQFTALSNYNGRQFRCQVTDATGTVPSEPATLIIGSGVVIVSEPEDISVEENGTATFKVVAAGKGLKYQWQTRLTTTAKWSNTGLSGNKTDTLSFKALGSYNGRQYRCVVTDEIGNFDESNPATLTIATSGVVEITSQPENLTVEENETAIFKVVADGTGLSYQWQTRLTPSAKWSNTGLNGNKTDTLSFKALSSYNGRQYRCVVTDGNGGVDESDPATLTIGSGVSITDHPDDVSVAADETATFKVVASGNGLKYQWQTRLTSTGKWSNTGLAGNKTDTLSFKALSSYDGRQYRCVVTDANGEIQESDPATLTILVPLDITSDPSDITVVADEMATFKVIATGTGLTYQWQTRLSATGKWSNTGLAGNKTDTLSFKALSSYDGRQYRCVVKDAAGGVAESKEATLTIASEVGITQDPVDATVEEDQTVTFKVTAAGTGLTYQWQTRLSASGAWSNTGLTGNKTDTLTFKALANYDGRQYRCVVKDSAGNPYESAPATLTVVKKEFVIDEVIYRRIDDTSCYVAGYTGSVSSLTIPDTAEGLTVTEIGEEAFMDNTTLTSINLPDTITVIRARAFKNCTNLSSMN